jgi:hypothetical protein
LAGADIERWRMQDISMSMNTLKRQSVSIQRLSMLVVAMAACAGSAVAQNDPSKPFGGAELSPPIDTTKAPSPVFSEPEFEKIAGLLAGSWKSSTPIKAGSDSFDVVTSVAPVFIAGMTDTMYAEVARGDAIDRPYRQAVWQLQRVKGKIRLKTMEFRRPRGEQLSAIGTWAVPEKFPPVSTDDLVTTLMVELTADGAGYKGATPAPYPTFAGGAVEMTSQIAFDGTTFRSADRGFGADGSVVWGPADNEWYSFGKIEVPVQVARTPEGLVMITYPTTTEGEVFKAGDRIAMHYVGTMQNGTIFDSSYERQSPFEYNFGQQLIAGWDMGMADARKGLKRRLIVPAPLAYGDRGNSRAKIPPGATLVFNIEVLNLTAMPAPVAQPVQAQPEAQPQAQPAEAKPAGS